MSILHLLLPDFEGVNAYIHYCSFHCVYVRVEERIDDLICYWKVVPVSESYCLSCCSVLAEVDTGLEVKAGIAAGGPGGDVGEAARG